MAVAEREPATEARGAPSRVVSHWLLVVVLGITFATHAGTLALYFFQDDYVAFGEIVSNGSRTYIWNLLTLQDLTPNWRVFTGLTYLVSYQVFGMAAWPTHALMLVLHVGSVALLYRAAWRVTSSVWASLAAALVFGISPAYAGTFGQLGSVTYTWAAFFLLATLCAVIECAQAVAPRRAYAWLAGAAVLYACAIASNESMAILFPVFGLAMLLIDVGDPWAPRLARAALRTLPFAAIGLAAAVSFTACDCTAAEDTFGLNNAHRAFLIYAGRMLYPIGLEPPHYIDAPHLYAGVAVLAAAAVLAVLGPSIGRVGAAWMILAIAPHALIETHTAHRFVYLATPGFAMMAAAAVQVFERWGAASRRAVVTATLVVGFAAVTPWYAWQSHAQHGRYREATADWRLLHDELQRVFPGVAPGGRVEVVGGPLTHPLDNFYVMPALAQTLWGPDAGLHTFAPDDPYAEQVLTGDNPYAARFEGRRLVPIEQR